MSTCRTCAHWLEQPAMLERGDDTGAYYTVGSCGNVLVAVDALDVDENPGEFMVVTTSDACCAHHEDAA